LHTEQRWRGSLRRAGAGRETRHGQGVHRSMCADRPRWQCSSRLECQHNLAVGELLCAVRATGAVLLLVRLTAKRGLLPHGKQIRRCKFMSNDGRSNFRNVWVVRHALYRHIYERMYANPRSLLPYAHTCTYLHACKYTCIYTTVYAYVYIYIYVYTCVKCVTT